MPHAKFESPSINVEKDFQLSSGVRKKGRKEERR